MERRIATIPNSDIHVGPADPLLRMLLPTDRRIVALVDSAVAGLYPEKFSGPDIIAVDGGEANKTLHTAGALYRRLVEMDADRSTFILGVGGGVVTDLAGFVASTFMRGVDFGFVSTTLLGQVDAAIGGKNGVDVDGYKNMAGTFAMPRFVVCDTEFLRTLPDREFRAGMAEVVKEAVIGDAELFGMVEAAPFDRLREDGELLGRIVERAVRVKAAIVAEDCCEHGRRRVLNLGHTLAHAVEKCSDRFNHGEAVAVGLGLTVSAAVAAGMMSERDGNRIRDLLCGLGFDLTPPLPLHVLFEAVRKDKKRENGGIHVIVPAAIGCVRDVWMSFDDAGSFFTCNNI